MTSNNTQYMHLTTVIYDEMVKLKSSMFASSSPSEQSLFKIDIDFITSSGNSKLKDDEEKILITIFSIVIILGIFGNLLVIWTILLNKNMRTTNNLFILNLAISDLTLCFFSIPFNVYKTLRHSWIFGDFLCRLAPFFQASNVFVSSMNITAIALDRFLLFIIIFFWEGF